MTRRKEIPETPPLPAGVKEAAKNRRLVIFLGAGIGCSVGMSSWAKIKQDLIAKVRPEKGTANAPRLKDLRKTFQSYEYYELFSRVRSMDQTTYDEVIKDALDIEKADKKKFREIIAALEKLNPVSFVTTNIDSLIDQTKNSHIKKITQCAPQLIPRDMIFKIHGDEHEHIFTIEAMKNYYEKDYFKSFIHNLFGSYCVLFIGFSFSDRELLNLGYINREAFDGKDHIQHFALLPSDHVPYTDLKFSFGIQSILYRNDKNLNHTNFVKTILSWVETPKISTELPTGDIV